MTSRERTRATAAARVLVPRAKTFASELRPLGTIPRYTNIYVCVSKPAVWLCPNTHTHTPHNIETS